MTTVSGLAEKVLVGRDRELQSLRERCIQAREGRGGFAYLAGEAGIGKTALLGQVHTWAARAGFATLWGRYLEHGHAPLHGLRQALAELVGINFTDEPNQLEPRLRAQLSSHFPALAHHSRALAGFFQPFDQDGRGTRPEWQQLYPLLFHLLSVAAGRQPLLLVLDDLHWADGLSLDCLAYLSATLADQRVLVLGAYRPEEPAPETLRRLVLAPQVCRVPVPRLDLQATAQLASRHGLSEDPLFWQELHQRTEGVPLFLEQWLGLCQAEPEKNAFEVLTQLPESVGRTIARRLHFLPPDELLLLQAAAILGEDFSPALVAQVAGWPLAHALEVLAALEMRGGLIQASQEQRFSFHHNLVGQVVREALPAALRQGLHLRAGEVLEQYHQQQTDQVFAMARHYTAAQQPDKAAAALFKAGQHAFGLGAFEEAQRCFQQALAALEQAPQAAVSKAELFEALGGVTLELGQQEAAHTWFQTALREQLDPPRRGLLYFKLSRSLASLEPQRKWDLIQQGLRETAAFPHCLERARILITLIRSPNPEVSTHSERVAQAVRWGAEALRILRRHQRSILLGELLNRLTDLPDKRVANLPRKRRLLQQAIRLAEQEGAWASAIYRRMSLARIWRGVDLAAGLQILEEGRRLAADWLPPHDNQHQYLLVELLRWHLAAGHQDQALDCYQRLKALEPEKRRYWEGLEQIGRHRLSKGEQAKWQQSCRDAAVLLWQHCPEEAWEATVSALHGCITHHTKPAHFLGRWSRLLRLAAHCGREEQLLPLIGQWLAEGPAYFEHFAELAVLPWGLQPASPPQKPVSLSHCAGLEDLAWRDELSNSQHTQYPRGEVEITPGPEVGLGWLANAPCLVGRAVGDFVFETRISAASHSQRAGGIVVWEGEKLLRFASGVDHIGQLSLGWNNGKDFRIVGAGHLPAVALRLCLVRQGSHYTALVSPDGHTWHTFTQVEFGSGGLVEVGLFAECNYEYFFPQPFPVRFADTALWTAAKSRALPALSSPRLYPLPQPAAPFCGLVGKSKMFGKFCQRLEQEARSTQPLLLCGESGSGKELAARAIHQLSGRAGGFVAVNVAELSPELISSELFGHRKGAFTGAGEDREGLFAAVQGGTLLLDEIGDLPLNCQIPLLRVLDRGEVRRLGENHVRKVDTRCIGATHRDLERRVAEGAFREDLFFRLGLPLEVPSLRERREDIPLLVAHFIARYAPDAECSISRAAMDKLLAHPWPDNVRGLEKVVERALRVAEDGVIEAQYLYLRQVPKSGVATAKNGASPDAEKLRRLLAECDGKVAALARRLGVSRLTVYRWIKAQGLDLDEIRAEM